MCDRQRCEFLLARKDVLFHTYKHVLRVVRAFLLEWSEADELPLDDMVGKFCLFLHTVDHFSTSLTDALNKQC